MKKQLKKILNLFHQQTLPAYVISKEPLVMVTYWKDFIDNKYKFYQALNGKKNVLIYFQLGWNVESNERVKEIKKDLGNLYLFGSFEFVFLTNSRIERKAIRKLGQKAIFCHQNAFIDYNKIKLIEDSNKKYSYVYLARISPFKRHELLEKTKDGLLIGAYKDNEKQYAREQLQKLKLNNHHLHSLKYNELPKAFSQAHVGVCLSKEEGAMFASTEYLLSGIPIVSTKSIGGRDFYFNENNSIITEDCSSSVNRAIGELTKRKHNPREIRNQTIQSMIKFRKFLEIDLNRRVKKNSKKYIPIQKTLIHKLGLRCTSFNLRYFLNRVFTLRLDTILFNLAIKRRSTETN